MKNSVFAILIILLFSSCADDESAEMSVCNVDSAADLPWLQEKISEMEQHSKEEMYRYNYIMQGMNEGQTVFIFGNCCPYCNMLIPVYDCSGEFVFHLSGDIQIQNLKVIWQPEAGECNFR